MRRPIWFSPLPAQRSKRQRLGQASWFAMRAEAWLPWNLGAAVLKDPPNDKHIAAAIAEWSADEAEAASAFMRGQRGLEATRDRLEGIYEELLQAPQPDDRLAEAAAIANFISGWVPNFDQLAPYRHLADAVTESPAPSPEVSMIQNILLPTVSDLRSEVSKSKNQLDALAAQPSASDS